MEADGFCFMMAGDVSDTSVSCRNVATGKKIKKNIEMNILIFTYQMMLCAQTGPDDSLHSFQPHWV